MKDFNSHSPDRRDASPPGQNALGICLAGVAALLGTPYLFNFIGGYVEELVYNAYGSRDFASLMYVVTFGLCGVAIYSVCRMILWYVLAIIVAFLSVRAAGLMVF